VLPARVGERARRELDPDALPAALAGEVEEEADRAADVEEAPGPAIRLQQVEHLAELLAVERELPLGGQDVEPEVVRLGGAVLLQNDVLAHLWVHEDEPAHLAADEGEA